MRNKHNINQFKELCGLLENIEVNDELHKDRIFNQIKFKMETGTLQKKYFEKGEFYMKRNNKKTIAIAAVLVCLISVFSVTSYGQGIIRSIVGLFHVGSMTITQYDKELPDISNTKNNDNDNGKRKTKVPESVTIEEARTIMGIDFAVPSWLPDGYKYSNSVMHSKNGVELQYTKDKNLISLLISRGENGISTAKDVRKETLGGTDVYFANGIVIWEGQNGLTYEMYQMTDKNFDLETLEKIIGTMSAETDNNSELYSKN